MDSQNLHPNLAKLAASYDDIVEQFERGVIDADEAERRVSALVARDDNGVQWRIGHEDGEWYRQDLDGRMRQASPPAWGVATDTGFDVSDGQDPLGDPRRHIWHAPVTIGGQNPTPPQMRHLLNEHAATWMGDVDEVVVGADLTNATIAAAARPMSVRRSVNVRVVGAMFAVLLVLVVVRLFV